jgi:hypothetical protein
MRMRVIQTTTALCSARPQSERSVSTAAAPPPDNADHRATNQPPVVKQMNEEESGRREIGEVREFKSSSKEFGKKSTYIFI